jgi:hypothetical protein
MYRSKLSGSLCFAPDNVFFSSTLGLHLSVKNIGPRCACSQPMPTVCAAMTLPFFHVLTMLRFSADAMAHKSRNVD